MNLRAVSRVFGLSRSRDVLNFIKIEPNLQVLELVVDMEGLDGWRIANAHVSLLRETLTESEGILNACIASLRQTKSTPIMIGSEHD